MPQIRSNPAVAPVLFGCWTPRDEAAQAAHFIRVRRAWRVTSSVKVRWPGLQRRRQGEGQGRRREAGSIGAPNPKLRGDEQIPDVGRDALETSGHVTSAPLSTISTLAR